MYKKRLLLDKDSTLHQHLVNLNSQEAMALHCKDGGSVLVVIPQEEFLTLKAMEEELLELKGLRVAKRTPYDKKEIGEAFEEKIEKMKEKFHLHEERKVQGVSVIEEEE